LNSNQQHKQTVSNATAKMTKIYKDSGVTHIPTGCRTKVVP